MKWIAQKMGLIYSTVVRVVAQYVQGGRVIQYKTKDRNRYRMNCKFTLLQEQWICSKNQLVEMKNMTLNMRCGIIMAKFEKTLCRAALSNIYKRNGISNLKPSYKWHLGKVTEDQYVDRKRQKIRQLMDYMQAGKSIVYIDETSTHMWEKRSKIWMPKEDPIYLRLK